MSLIKWNRRNRFPDISLPNFVDEFFDNDDGFFTPWRKNQTVPAVNVINNEDSYTLELAAPGMKKEDFNISVDKGLLTVSAEDEKSSEEKDDHYTRREFSYSAFKRSFWLPENAKADDVNAHYEDGLLTIDVPIVAAEKPDVKVIAVS